MKLRICTIFLFLLLISSLVSSPSVSAQTRYAECDSCGYCNGKPAPGGWEKCRQCLYPGANPNPSQNETLKIDEVPNSPTYNRQIQPAPGIYYTQLGCLNTNVSSFSDAGASGGLLNFLLTKLIFPTVGTLAFISLIYGAFLIATGQGQAEQINRGKSYVYGSIVGLLFTLGSIFIINIIGSDILKIPGFEKGSIATITVAGRCAPNQTDCPEMVVKIGTEVIDGPTLIPGTNNTHPLPENFKTYSTNISKFDVANPPAITFNFDNDFYNASLGQDRNLYVKDMRIDKFKCSQIKYTDTFNNQFTETIVPNGTNFINLAHTGFVSCFAGSWVL